MIDLAIWALLYSPRLTTLLCAEIKMQVGEYRLNNPHNIETPEFLVYEDMVGYNIDAVIRVCGSVGPDRASRQDPQVGGRPEAPDGRRLALLQVRHPA